MSELDGVIWIDTMAECSIDMTPLRLTQYVRDGVALGSIPSKDENEGDDACSDGEEGK